MSASRRKQLKQLDYIHSYLCKHFKYGEGDGAYLVERNYSDRDYAHDFASLYSAEHPSRGARVTRVHYFQGLDKDALEQKVSEILEAQLRAESPDQDEVKQLCASLSEDHYLGFSVIRPKDGCPVGRTFLRALGGTRSESDDSYRHMGATHGYTAYLGPLSLSVEGLHFQQQDEGTSVCATIATWSALMQHGSYERITPVTPAAITEAATNSKLNSGGGIPANGLNAEQVCDAISKFGAVPSLSVHGDGEVAKQLLGSMVRSRFAPVLMMERVDGISAGAGHAVTLTGLRLKWPKADPFCRYDFKEDQINGVYFHDDRRGPYMRAMLSLSKDKSGSLLLEMKGRPHEGTNHKEVWKLVQVICPLPHGVNLSNIRLQIIADHVAQQIDGTVNGGTPEDTIEGLVREGIETQFWIAKQHEYLWHIAHSFRADSNAFKQISSNVPWPKYVGVVRIRLGSKIICDFVLDSSSTSRNPKAIMCFMECEGDISESAILWMKNFVSKIMQLHSNRITVYQVPPEHIPHN